MTTRSSLWRAGTTSGGVMATTRPSVDRGPTISTAGRAATPSSVALGRTASIPPKARTKCRRVPVTTGYTPLTMGQQTGSLAARVTIGSYLAKRTTSPKTARSRAPLVGHHNPGVKGVTWHRSAATPAHFLPLFTQRRGRSILRSPLHASNYKQRQRYAVWGMCQEARSWYGSSQQRAEA